MARNRYCVYGIFTRIVIRNNLAGTGSKTCSQEAFKYPGNFSWLCVKLSFTVEGLYGYVCRILLKLTHNKFFHHCFCPVDLPQLQAGSYCMAPLAPVQQ